MGIDRTDRGTDEPDSADNGRQRPGPPDHGSPADRSREPGRPSRGETRDATTQTDGERADTATETAESGRAEDAPTSSQDPNERRAQDAEAENEDTPVEDRYVSPLERMPSHGGFANLAEEFAARTRSREIAKQYNSANTAVEQHTTNESVPTSEVNDFPASSATNEPRAEFSEEKYATASDGKPASTESESPAGEARNERENGFRSKVVDAEQGDEPEVRGHMPELRTNVWDRHPGEYNPPNSAEERAIGDRPAPFENPFTWINDVNPGYGPNRQDRQANCADCMRAVERNWRGDSQVSAGINGNGELNTRTEAWSGERFRRLSIGEIEQRLTAGGDGSSAMIGVDWRGGGGHYFNAVNHRGQVLALDGQTGKIETWPPSTNGLGYDASMITLSEAIVRDRDGKVI